MPPVSPQVTLVRCTDEPEELLASAAKLCYASETGSILEQEHHKAAGFIRKLVSMGHMSPIEHVSMTFYVEGVSRAMTHQLVRHRLASYSQRSQRYVRHDTFDYVVPPALEGRTVRTGDGPVDAEAYFAETMDLLAERYRRLNEALGAIGETSNQDARYVLPNACETKIFVSMNARELLHFFAERLCRRAQWEIRAVADQMLGLAREACPAVFDGAGPKCVHEGGCPEGKMTCGQYADMQRLYGRDG
jgi:thymidylate synthase (FAD)